MFMSIIPPCLETHNEKISDTFNLIHDFSMHFKVILHFKLAKNYPLPQPPSPTSLIN